MENAGLENDGSETVAQLSLTVTCDVYVMAGLHSRCGHIFALWFLSIFLFVV